MKMMLAMRLCLIRHKNTGGKPKRGKRSKFYKLRLLKVKEGKPSGVPDQALAKLHIYDTTEKIFPHTRCFSNTMQRKSAPLDEERWECLEAKQSDVEPLPYQDQVKTNIVPDYNVHRMLCLLMIRLLTRHSEDHPEMWEDVWHHIHCI